MVLRDTDVEGARAVAAQIPIRARIGALALDHADSPFGRVTISLGV